MNKRELVIKFFRLTVSKKNGILEKLGLNDEGDRLLPDLDRYKAAILRAKERNIFCELEHEILRVLANES